MSVFALIGARYLDTEHDPEHIAKLEAALAARGVVGIRRLVFEYLAAAALWWNVLWWEWGSLDERDVIQGWKQNALLFGAVAAFFGLMFFSATAALVAAVAAHLLTLWIGLGLRRGTLASSEEQARRASGPIARALRFCVRLLLGDDERSEARLVESIAAAFPEDAARVEGRVRYKELDPEVARSEWVRLFLQCTSAALKAGDTAKARAHLELMSCLYAAGNATAQRTVDFNYVVQLMQEMGDMNDTQRRQCWRLIPQNLRKLCVARWGTLSFMDEHQHP